MSYTIAYREESAVELVATYPTKREAVEAVKSIGGRPWGGRGAARKLPAVFDFPNKLWTGTAYIMKTADAKEYASMFERGNFELKSAEVVEG